MRLRLDAYIRQDRSNLITVFGLGFKMKLFLAFGCAWFLCAASAHAEFIEDPSFSLCTNATGYYDVAATNDWLRRQSSSDAGAMREISGKWFAEFNERSLGMRYNNVFTYLPTGVMDFTTKTCSTFQGYERCTDDYGHGLFTAHRGENGWIFITRNITSQTRINACGGFYARMENGQFVDQSGTVWQRLE
jgi:hypothetical protein